VPRAEAGSEVKDQRERGAEWSVDLPVLARLQ